MNEYSSKQALRAALRQRRDGLPAAQRASAGEQAINHLVNHPVWQRATLVALYRAFGSELDPGPLTTRASAARKRFVYPRVESPGVMSFRDPGADGVFEHSQYGTEQPGPDCAVVSAGSIDLLVVPLVGWDATGYRLGYGGGYYDRYLEGTQADRVGLAFAAQEVAELPTEAHDMRLDWLVTEAGVRRFN